jgi:uncharacterized protein (TIGR00288 family)
MEIRNDPLERHTETRADAEGVHQAALLIDFDNVTMGIRSNLGQEMRNLLNSEMIRGKVAVQRAYADWRRYPQYIVPLSEASIDLIFAPAYGSSKKNATDIRLAIDALELVFVRPEIRTYILMSGDSDFSSLVLKLKEYGKYVIGVGIQESSSDLLVQNCDEYYSYTALSGLSKTSDQVIESHDPWLLAAKAVDKMVERGDTMRSDRLKQVMLEIDPSFNEKELGYNKFNRFVVQAASKGLVSIQKMENGQYGVAPGEKGRKERKSEPAEKKEKKERKETRAPRAGGRRDRDKGKEEGEREPKREGVTDTRRARPKLTMETALELLDRALGILLEGGADSVRDSDVKRRMLELDPNFDQGELGFSKFSKFLQAAEEQGAIELERGPNGNYHVARPSKGRRKAAGKAAGKAAAKAAAKAVEKAPVRKDVGRKDEARDEAEKVDAGASTMQRLARFFFGPNREEPEESELAAGGAKAAAERAAPRRESTAEAGRPSESRGRRGRPSRGGSAETASPSRSRKDPRPQDRAARGEGQRGGGRGGSGAGPAAGRGRGGERSAADRRTSGRRREEPRGPRERKEEASPRPDEAVAAAESLSVTPRASMPETPMKEAPAQETPVRKAPAEEAPAREAPVREPSAPEPKPSAAQPAAEQKSTVTDTPQPGVPRGTIRGRRGSRGRYPTSDGPPPILPGQTGRKPVGKAEKSGDKPARQASVSEKPAARQDDGAIVAHLTAYPGVGGKTAEALVDAFGADTLRVLDEEPDRVRAILSDHRAERVLEARREERASGGS